ncbi:hypothetical protein F5148DRAFT_1247082 [Russula earlei]|uniref:Uncharacterized protein n=1 Tax=Russula earlei TaxID=71964 RepID=A0ACC0TUH5_9AGAM|nr:hypothetical protein F5148DRAFT_1247082 [Russula earlei]
MIRLLSHALDIFLRLSTCKPTSSHLQTPLEHQLSHDHLPHQQFPANDDESFSMPAMSQQPYIVTPSSYLQSSFNLTLIEYSHQTGIDLTTHPFAAIVNDIHSVDATIAALQERILSSSDSKIGDSIAGLMSKLKSIVHIVFLLSPSEALSENIDSRFSPAKAIIISADVLLAIATDCGTSYDAILDLFDCIESYLKLLGVYVEIPPHMVVIEKAMKILFQLILVLALATQQAQQGRLRRR